MKTLRKFEIGDKVILDPYAAYHFNSYNEYKRRIGTVIEREPYEILVEYTDGHKISSPLHLYRYANEKGQEKEKVMQSKRIGAQYNKRLRDLNMTHDEYLDAIDDALENDYRKKTKSKTKIKRKSHK